jgi:hypothetical protein
LIRKIFALPVRVALLVSISLLFGNYAIHAQSGNRLGPTSGRIISIEPKKPKGALKVIQANKLKPVEATEGMLVRRGQMLILEPKARALIICGDGKKRELAPGWHGSPCKKPCSPEVCGIRYDGSTIGATRGPDTDKGAFPVIISPRKTLLRNLRPTIGWSPIAGAKENTIYKVTLYGDNLKVIWTRNVIAETRLTYPDNEPSLMQGQIYKIIITADGLTSQQDDSPGLGFTTLTADKAQALADKENEKKKLGLPAVQTRFLISNLYAARKLYAEAIEELETLYTSMKEPAVARMLGDLYMAIGLNREAEKKYLQALSLTAANDLEGQGEVEKSLAQAYENLGILDQAIARLQKAIVVYRRLKNISMVNALLKDERRLKKR